MATVLHQRAIRGALPRIIVRVVVAMVVTATILVRSHSLAIDERLKRKSNASTSIRSWGRGRCVALRAGPAQPCDRQRQGISQKKYAKRNIGIRIMIEIQPGEMLLPNDGSKHHG